MKSDQKYKIVYFEAKEEDHRYIKQSAAQHGKTIKQFIIDAICFYMLHERGRDEEVQYVSRVDKE